MRSAGITLANPSIGLSYDVVDFEALRGYFSELMSLIKYSIPPYSYLAHVIGIKFKKKCSGSTT